MYTISSALVVKLVSDRDREIYEVVNFVIICNAISLFGVAANVMNILVFYKQGFNTTINISFFGLAVSDLCSLLTLLWFSICVNPLFVDANENMAPHEVQYLSAGLPHLCFARITGWITIFITAERCLCILIPLKIKQIITPRRTKITICSIYVVIMASFVPEYETTYIAWTFFPSINRTLLRLAFTTNRANMEGLVWFTYSIFGSASFVAVSVFTIILVVQLKQKSKWRKKANADKNSGASISTRERKTVTMVIMIATVLIACYTPGVAVSMATFVEPKLSIVGLYVNAFFVMWSIAFVFDAFNSSVNIFLYYNMSTKYRETFRQVVGIDSTNSSASSQSQRQEREIA